MIQTGPKSLNVGYRKKETERIEQENHAFAKRLFDKQANLKKKKMDEEYQAYLKYRKQIQKVPLQKKSKKDRESRGDKDGGKAKSSVRQSADQNGTTTLKGTKSQATLNTNSIGEDNISPIKPVVKGREDTNGQKSNEEVTEVPKSAAAGNKVEGQNIDKILDVAINEMWQVYDKDNGGTLKKEEFKLLLSDTLSKTGSPPEI